MHNSEVINWYSGKTILLTGVTGFIGKVVLEKLLRVCNVESVYLIIRPKLKKSFEDRCKTVLKHVVFENLHATNPKFVDKVKFVEGDMDLIDLGLSNDSRQELIDNVNVVIHNAANVRFDLDLKSAIITNVEATWSMLELAKQMKQLITFVYVSTCYSQCGIKVTEERAYKGVMDPFKVIKMIKTLDDDMLNIFLPKLLGIFPNTYSFSKSLSEDIVNNYRDNFPIVVVRPAIVTASFQDPMPSYMEGLFGLGGFAVASGRGILRTVKCDPNIKVLYCPADYVANCVIASTVLQAKSKSKEITFYNASSSFHSSRTFNQVIEKLIENTPQYAYDFSIWRPGGMLTQNSLFYKMRLFLFQLLPAILIDMMFRLSKKPPILMRAQRKIVYLMSLLYNYITYPYHFDTTRFENLKNVLNEVDAKLFPTSLAETKEFFELRNYYGTRKYILKEKDENIPRARKVAKFFTGLDIFCKICIWYILLKFSFNYFTKNYF